jgi:hypothetical protein
MSHRTWLPATALPCAALTLALTFACGGGGGGSTVTPPAPGVAVSGTVSAPAATTQPAARAAGIRAAAATVNTSAPGTTPLGAGVTVNLIQIDAAGAQVGAVLATTVTAADGTYTLTAPAGFTPGPSYVVVAEAPGGSIQGFVTSTTANADPYTQATVTLVTGALAQAGAALGSVSASTIAAVQETVLGNSGNIALAGTPTTQQMVAALASSVQNDVEDANTVTSLTAPGGITGLVQDAAGNPLAGVQILVRTFGDQVTMATTRTGATGAYAVQVPAGTYIVGAINDGTASMAASGWWSTSGMQTSQYQASKVTIAAAPVTCDFTLQPGGLLHGTVSASDTGLPLSGITVALNDFTSGQTFMFVKTQPNGTVNFNVAAGTYYVSMRNNTLQPYATGCIDGSLGGGRNISMAAKVTVVAGQSQGGQMSLVPGHQIQGLVSDPVTGPVSGMVVRFQDYDAGGVGSESVRTGADGTYGMWVQPGHYNVWTRGQQVNDVDCTAGGQTVNFAAAVGQITATLQDQNHDPVGQVFVYVSSAPSGSTQSFEISNSDGTVTVYTTAATSNAFLAFLADTGMPIGTSVYQAGSDAGSGTGILAAVTGGSVVPAPAAGTTTALGTVILPPGAMLTGTVSSLETGQPMADQVVSIRIGGATGIYRLMNTRTRSDGSYGISLPAGATLSTVIAFGSNGSFSLVNGENQDPGVYDLADNLVMGLAGTTLTQNLSF